MGDIETSAYLSLGLVLFPTLHTGAAELLILLYLSLALIRGGRKNKAVPTPLLLGELNITDLDVRPLQSWSSWWTQLTGEHHALSLLVIRIT